MTTTQLITITDNAAKKIKQLILQENNPEIKLRTFVSGGGCSGFLYGFTFEENPTADDLIISKNDISLLIDPISYQYLIGSEIDYTEELKGSQFVINNPNAKSTCGCGSSFSA
jgi:iron-sulfur cluster insertion protein